MLSSESAAIIMRPSPLFKLMSSHFVFSSLLHDLSFVAVCVTLIDAPLLELWPLRPKGRALLPLLLLPPLPLQLLLLLLLLLWGVCQCCCCCWRFGWKGE